MKRIRFSDLARDDLDEIWLSIASDNLDAADRFVDRLDELLRKLLDFPGMGVQREDIHPGVQSFPYGRNYLVFYRSMPYGIAVLRIVHGGRDLQTLDYPSLPERG